MMVGMFIIYLVSLVLTLFKKPNLAFTLIALNVIICFLMLMHHSTDLFVSGI